MFPAPALLGTAWNEPVSSLPVQGAAACTDALALAAPSAASAAIAIRCRISRLCLARWRVTPWRYTVLTTHIRGRHGFDVVGSPAELQAEVSGRPRKTTGNNKQVRIPTSHSLPSLNT